MEKLEKLEDLGIDPYPASWGGFEERVENAELEGMELGEDVTVVGRIRATRGHGGIVFADIYDETGKIQVCFREDVLGGTGNTAGETSGVGSAETPEVKEAAGESGGLGFQHLNLLDLGDFIGVRGELFETEAGELTVLAKELRLLSKAIRPLPSEWYGLKDKEERYRKRYLDLIMNPEVRDVFKTRTKILTMLREYLDEHGFMEVETPILQPIYGGASATPFVTHLEALDTDFYLRISDELYLKRLIVGGFEKVYEVSKDFRNEGIDRQHSPEFTQIEFYWAYADYEDLMKFTEEMLSHVIEEVTGGLKIEFEGQELDFTPPWPRLTYRDVVLEHTGIDINKVKTEEELRDAIRNELAPKLSGAQGERNLKVANTKESEVATFTSRSEEKKRGLKSANVEEILSNVGYGALLDALYKEFCRPNLVQPMFLIDHPAESVALAKRKEDDASKVARFQLLVAGYEMINAYNELNDPQDQKERWQEQDNLAERGLEEHETLDEDYIEALEYGMPPTAGWGMGIDRLTAILTDQRSIRDVILFPLMRPERAKEKS